VLAGCGDSGDGEAKRAKVSASASEDSFETALPDQEETEPVYADGPEGVIDKKADEEGWSYDGLYGSASEFVSDICESLPSSAKDSSSRPQWLAESGMLDGDGKAILRFGVPKLCPKWKSTVSRAVAGTYERWLSNGDYEITPKPKPLDASGESDVMEAAPGTYRISGDLSDCYWERTSKSGDILDNQFASQARVITVTLNVGELFRSEGCAGAWKPVR
ncbi:hypothetical protein ABZ383_30525, partial [Streptomyces sp. NPDC005900]